MEILNVEGNIKFSISFIKNPELIPTFKFYNDKNVLVSVNENNFFVFVANGHF
ncbi:hypothetical protein HMPREF0554_2413 [Pseudoleptotrichia goodfellowii F0264]|uniref:Uncharacterized protein n=1 Tax=Pseudoleptotrichia goodfellowii F0264 TaxID=596323 RepID=D0GJI1_9FUSO|nr:hypothetical protein HMPREF0554_2413 [Pseudoleptotrichia goodfellowii F0264]